MRMPIKLRDEIAELAAQQDSTMLAIVAEAIEQLRQQQWWDTLHAQLDEMSATDIEDYQREAEVLEATLRDGLE